MAKSRPKKQTYADRQKDGRKLHTVWLSKEATEALEFLAKHMEKTKTEVIERVLVHMRMRQLALDEEQHVAPPHKLPGREPARSPSPPGSPGDLAQRVLARGRREATVVATGRRVVNGREHRS